MRSLTALSIIVVIAFSSFAQSDWELVVPSASYDGGGLIETWPDHPLDAVFSWYDEMSYENMIIGTRDTFQTLDTLLIGARFFNTHPTDFRTILVVDATSQLIKTTDRGETWSVLLGVCYGNADFCDTDPNYIWALPQDDFGGGVLSYSSDGGTTWNDASGDFSGYISSIFALNTDGLHALLEDGSEIYRTTNGGTNWVSVYSGAMLGESFWNLSVSKADPNRIAIAYDYSVVVSNDGGATWTACTTFMEYNWGIECDPFDPDLIILGNDEGVFRSGDFGETWEYWPSSSLTNYVEEFAVTTIGGERRYYASSEEGIYKRSGGTVSGGPRLTYRFPFNGAWVSEDTLIILGFSDFEGIDATTAVIEVNGSSYTTADPELTAVGDTLVFYPPFPWLDGDITVTLITIEDTGGEITPDAGSSFTFHIDKTPPQVLFYEPDSGAVLTDAPSGIMLVFHDYGSGNTHDTWDFTDGSITLGSWSAGVMMEGSDTIFIDFGTAGIHIDLGDTVSFLFRGWDSPDIGAPNMFAQYWWFVVATGITEKQLPENNSISVSPNPFNSTCAITAPSDVEIGIFNLHGQQIDRLPSGTTIWRPSEDVPSGIYSIKAINSMNKISTDVIYLK